MNMVDATLKVLAQGYRPYRGAVENRVYEGLECRTPPAARWFVHDHLPRMCLGCKRMCIARDAQGFQLTLPMGPPRRTAPGQVMFAQLSALTVDQILTLKRSLTVREAAYCLGCSDRFVYNLLDEGRLKKLGRDTFVRVDAASVRKFLDMD